VNQKSAELSAAPVAPAFTVLLSATPRGARLARLLTDAQLRSWGLPPDPARHVVAELAANAASHGCAPGRNFRLTLTVTGALLRIEVTDTRGEELPEIQAPEPDAESGRGLLLVDALAHRWGIADDHYPRKIVWAELHLTPDLGRPCCGGSGVLSKEP
jgi:anti-sigma regulatory factor (Ser/Thr protein kinase)